MTDNLKKLSTLRNGTGESLKRHRPIPTFGLFIRAALAGGYLSAQRKSSGSSLQYTR